MGKKVLIVDDSGTMRKIVGRSLRQAGLDVGEIIEAADGLQGLEALEANDVDIVLSDINMPNMDGMEFLKEKNSRDDMKNVPMFMISTEASTEVLETAKAYGAKGSIKKPFTPDTVADVLGEFF